MEKGLNLFKMETFWGGNHFTNGKVVSSIPIKLSRFGRNDV
jgi:hypothetical protein